MTDTPNAKSSVIDTTGYEPEDGIEPTPDDRPEVVELATLLPTVAALAAYVNSDKCSDQDRARLREFVPGLTYKLLLCNLTDLGSWFAREYHKVVRAPKELIIDLMTFYDRYDEPIPHKKRRS